MRLSFIPFMIGLSTFCVGQPVKNERQYFDKYWLEVSSASQATYYRTFERVEDKYLVTDRYILNDTRQMIAFCTALKPKLIFDGEVSWYYLNGNKKEEGTFRNNKRLGIFREYYENGNLQSEIFYNEDNKFYHQVWSESGEPLLSNGTGHFQMKDTEFGYNFNLEIKDSILLRSYFHRPEYQDTVYLRTDTPAEFTGGMEGFYTDLSKALQGKYPKEARRRGIEGRIFIEFIVDQQGNMTDKKVVKGIGGGCDEVALEVFGQMKKWTPAYYDGKPVKVKMVLPVVFRLN